MLDGLYYPDNNLL